MGEDTQVPRSTMQILLLAAAMAGIQFVFSIQFAIGGPLLQDTFKLEAGVCGIILTVSGCLSGLLVQPIVGVYSDNLTSSYGRRRPFIFWGAVLAVIGMAVVGNSVQIGLLMGDKADGTSTKDHMFGLVIAISFLTLMNIAVNMISGPMRALINDLLPPAQHHKGNSIITLLTGSADVTANLIGAQFLMSKDPYRWLFFMGCGYTTLATIPTLIVGKEKPFTPTKTVNHNPIVVFQKIGLAFVHMNEYVLRIFIVFFASWAALTPFNYFETIYFAQNVKGATPTVDPHAYQAGIQLGMYARAVYASIGTVFSLILSQYANKMGVRTTYFLSQVLATICYGALWLCAQEGVYNHSYGVAVATIFTGLIAINMVAFNSIPFGILFAAIEKEQTGLYMGVLNCAATISQVVANLIVSNAVLPHKNQDVSWGIGFGGILSAVAAALVFIIKIPPHKSQHMEAVISETTPLVQ